MRNPHVLGGKLIIVSAFFKCAQLIISPQKVKAHDLARPLIKLLRLAYSEAHRNGAHNDHEAIGQKLLELANCVDPTQQLSLAEHVLADSFFSSLAPTQQSKLRIQAAEKILSLANDKAEADRLKIADTVFTFTCGLPFGETVLRQVLVWSRHEHAPDFKQEVRAMEWVHKRLAMFPSYLGKVSHFNEIASQFWADIGAENIDTRTAAMSDAIARIDMQMRRSPTASPCPELPVKLPAL